MVGHIKVNSSEIQIKKPLLNAITFSSTGNTKEIIRFVSNELQENGLDGICSLVARSVSTLLLRTCTTDRNQIYPNGKVPTLTNVLTMPCKWQTACLGRSDASKFIVNRFRRPTILQLNIEDLTASKMSFLYHLAAQYEALVITPGGSLQCCREVCSTELLIS